MIPNVTAGEPIAPEWGNAVADAINAPTPYCVTDANAPGATSGDTTLTGWSFRDNVGGFGLDNSGSGANDRILFPAAGIYSVSFRANGGDSYVSNVSGVLVTAWNLDPTTSMQPFTIGTTLAQGATWVFVDVSGTGGIRFLTKSGTETITRTYSVAIAKVA